MDKNIKLSILVPIHDMSGGADFLWRSVNALTAQTFQNFELIITKAGKMAENTNAGIKKARGELIKILYLDDRLANVHALQDMVDNFTESDDWMMVGTSTNPNPLWTDDIISGNNKLGSPSALLMRNDKLLFDEKMSWLLDCDYYWRMYQQYGQPKILNGVHVLIGEGEHQMTHILTDEEKAAEAEYLKQKYGDTN